MDAKGKGQKYRGGSFLEVTLKETYGRLGKERIDNLYRASLLGGDVGARMMLAGDERCLQKWGEGSLTKAVSLLEVWASTAVLRLLQHQENQEAVRKDTALGCSLLFHSDRGEVEAELLAYQEGIKTERCVINNGGTTFAKYSTAVLYLRTLGALADKGVPSFKLLPVPIGNLSDMEKQAPNWFKALDVNIFLPVYPWLLIPEALIVTLDTAQNYFKRMEA